MSDQAERRKFADLMTRLDGQQEWLFRNHPEVFTEQKHLDEGSIERAYWHYGYMVALRDVIQFLTLDAMNVS